MLVHLRLTTPPELTGRIVDLVCDDGYATNVSLLRGAVVEPAGDLVECDVAREAASALIDRIRETGLGERGGITIADVPAAPFRLAHDLDKRARGEADDAVIWDVVLEQAHAGATGSWSFYTFLTLATCLAAVAVITDSPVLVVGAMVVSPDYLPVAAISTGLAFRRTGVLLGGLRLLVLGYVAAIAVCTALCLVGRLVGWITQAQVLAARPMTGFIWHPDRWSFVVAILAGIAGVLALTASKANTLVGVFISVTTIPAAGNLAVALATGAVPEITGSLTQLGINIAGMAISGVATLLLQAKVIRPPLDRSLLHESRLPGRSGRGGAGGDGWASDSRARGSRRDSNDASGPG